MNHELLLQRREVIRLAEDQCYAAYFNQDAIAELRAQVETDERAEEGAKP